MSVKQWWNTQHHAAREACTLSIIACFALSSLWLIPDSHQELNSHTPLFNQASSFRVQSPHGSYSLVFSEQLGFIGDQSFQPIARIKRSETINLRKSLKQTSIMRSLGQAQLDQEQQIAYGFDKGVSINAPGHDAWTLASGLDGRAYALDADGGLYELNVDLASLVNRPVEALRDSSLGLPEQLERVTNYYSTPNWSLQYMHTHWWLQQKSGNPVLIDQRICNDWINVFTHIQAVTFLNAPKAAQQTKMIEFEGTNNQTGRSVIQIFDNGPARNSKTLRIIERREKIAGFTLREFFAADIDHYLFTYPNTAFRSKQLIPFNPQNSSHIRVGSFSIKKIGNKWQISDAHPLDQRVLENFFKQLSQLPTEQPLSNLNIGSISSGALKYEIPHTKQSQDIIRLYPRHSFFDKRLFPTHKSQAFTGLVIHSNSDAPQLYQRLPDGTWDLDPELNKTITEFIEALSAARVQNWQSAFDSKQAWTSTLTIAIGENRVILKKTDDHLIGIESLNIQGRLDQASLDDLFGE